MRDQGAIDPAAAEALQEISDAAARFMIGQLEQTGIPLEGILITVACKSGDILTSEAVPPEGDLAELHDRAREFLDGEFEMVSSVADTVPARGHA